jgi:hypothetical protein
VRFAAGVEHEVNDKRIGQANVVAFGKPGGIDVFRRLVRQRHQGRLQFFAGFPAGWYEQIDIGSRAVITVGKQGISADQQIIHAMLVQCPDQRLEVIQGCRTGVLAHARRVAAISAMAFARHSS